MIGLLQRVTEAAVTVDGRLIGQIGPGLAVLVGVQRGDEAEQARRLAERLIAYRVFEDPDGKMNLSLADTGGGLLLIPQFTLAADTRKGNRAGFSRAADPETGRVLFAELVTTARQTGISVETGQFGAHMDVSLINQGPVTFWLEVPPSATHIS
ncbi:MAG: D-aminoacyl-tRNA deacylase [Gammaproteobacteria bacterium]|jgi:D-tyrosyl-tRNA(Tyr) deacylase|nr:D-tyrosyl-tRNA(Tyr) deacylase [Chromatiales bacterium]MDP6675714.1 D-aminoacyl-tRNA deacylase [Gammaproteobacteria bacterium]